MYIGCSIFQLAKVQNLRYTEQNPNLHFLRAQVGGFSSLGPVQNLNVEVVLPVPGFSLAFLHATVPSNQLDSRDWSQLTKSSCALPDLLLPFCLPPRLADNDNIGA
jgi:hypothetical protein